MLHSVISLRVPAGGFQPRRVDVDSRRDLHLLLLRLGRSVFPPIQLVLRQVTHHSPTTFYFINTLINRRNVISTWSSGTGAAGIVGASSYVGLNLLGIETAMLVMLVVPATMGLV